jgi:hypothetical protein
MEMYIMKQRKAYKGSKRKNEQERTRIEVVEMDYHINERKRRIKQTLSILKNYKEVEIEKAIAMISINLGITDRKIKEYLTILENAGYIKRENGYITVK